MATVTTTLANGLVVTTSPHPTNPQNRFLMNVRGDLQGAGVQIVHTFTVMPTRLTVLVVDSISAGRMEVGAMVLGPDQGQLGPGTITTTWTALTMDGNLELRDVWIRLFENPNPNPVDA